MGVLRMTRMQRAFAGQVAGLAVSLFGLSALSLAAAAAYQPWLGLAVGGAGLVLLGFRITWLYGTLYDVDETQPHPEPTAVRFDTPELAEPDEPPTMHGGAVLRPAGWAR